MEKLKKYLLVFLMAIVMVVNMLPAQVMAAEGDSGQDPAAIHERMKEQADAWYGEGGTYNPKVSVTITPSPSNQLLAGSVLDYTVAYTFRHAENWEEGYSGQTAFYDYYGIYDEDDPDSEANHPNTVTIHLPAGLLLTGSGLPGEITNDPADPDNKNTAIEHTYTLPFPKRIEASAMHSTFTITIYVGNNGTEDSINEYVFPEDMVTLSTTFEVLDKQDPRNYTTVGEYTHTVTASPEPITTYSPDQWGVKKTGVPEETKYNETDKTVTFTWDVEVGMLEDDEIKTLNADYSRDGRDLLQALALEDSFLTSINKEGVTVEDPESVTIRKLTGSSSWGEAKSVAPGTDIPLWGEGADDALLMNHAKLIDLDGDKTNPPEQDTPTYTKYRVEVTYPVSDDWIAHFPLLEGYELTQNNTAKTEAQLAKIPEKQTDEADAEQTVPLPFDGAAKLRLYKRFTDYNGDETDYNSALERLYGPLSYTISADSNFTIYEKSGDTFVPVEGMSGASEYSLKTGIDYYLVPGIEYTVKENLSDAQQRAMVQTNEPKEFVNTPYVDEAWNVTFRNKETVGRIVVTKEDNAGRKMPGVGFTLYADDGETVVAQEQITSSQGTISFNRLPYGDYILRETKPPAEGYVPSEDYPVTIDAQHTNVAVTRVNKVSASRLILTKYVGLAEGQINHKANDHFPGTFILQRTTSNPETATDWQEVSGVSTTVSPLGQIIANVDAFDQNGNPYWYRFVETIPEGYYDPAATDPGSTRYAYSEAVKLTEVKDGTEYARPLTDPVEVSMYNRKYVRAHVSKLFFITNNDGTLSGTSLFTTTVKLFAYSQADGSDIHEVTGATPDNIIGNNSSGTDYADWLNLPLYKENKRIHYVVQEGSVKYGDQDYETFILDEAQTGNIVMIDTDGDGTKERCIDISSMTTAFTDDMYAETTQRPMTKELVNVQNLYPVQIWKRNYYTNAGVEGAGVTVYDQNGNIAYGYIFDGNVKVKTLLKDIPIPNQGGSDYYVRIYLAPGQTYTFEETVNETGLHFHHLSDDGKITLPATPQSFANKDTRKNTTRTVFNAPDPLVRINKEDSTDSSKKLTAVFTAYTKEADGRFAPVLDGEGNPVTINSSNTDQTYRFAPGEYYFAETLVPEGYLDPNKNFADYYAMSSDYEQGRTTDGQDLTFVKGVVQNMPKSGTSDNIWRFTFKNIPNKGKLKVLKYVDGKLTTLQPGFKITVTGDDGSSAELKTDENGEAVFELPVFKEDGVTKIRYIVSEELDDVQKFRYTRDSEDQFATLNLGAETDEDLSGEKLIVKNITKIRFTASKVFRKTWEYGFTGHSEPLSGATIGLFEEVGGNWVLVDQATLDQSANPQVSDENGKVSFSGLTRGVNYILVELASGDPDKFPYKNGFLELPPDGALTTSIPNSELSRFNVLPISGSETSRETETTEFPVGAPAVLVNQNHWIQFDITKWLDPEQLRVLSAGEFGWGAAYDPYVSGSGFREVDNVIFDVYRYILPDGEMAAEFSPDGEGWTNLGTYTTGTLYVDDMRQNGRFITIPDQDINENYIYVIREKNVGPNNIRINPNFKYTIWSAAGKDVSVSLPEAGFTPRYKHYEMDTVNYDDIVDVRLAPGTGAILLASLRLTKWRDYYDDNGNLTGEYTPLPDATFELRLPDGTLLDTITSGLDYTLTTSADARAIAQSTTFRLWIETDAETGESQYYLRDYATEQTIAAVDAEPFHFEVDGNEFTGYRVPIKLVETVVPDEFAAAVEEMDTYLCFADITKTHEGQSWVFNDAYFVKYYGPSDETLASEQHAPSWFITNASEGQNIYNVSVGDLENPSPIRIVNYPTNNAMVHIMKYGYKPSTATLNMTGEELDAFPAEEISRVPLKEVEMSLLKKDTDGQWKPWDYLQNDFGTAEQAKFMTAADGSFLFPDGLTAGEYRLYEEALNDTDKLEYEIAYPKARPRQFVVGEKGLINLSLYNPMMLSLRLEKEDLDGNKLSEVDFTIHAGEEEATYNTHGGNWLMFKPVRTGKYWISENKAGYSAEYLEKYLQSEYDLTGFTKAPGADIGYHYMTKAAENGTDYVIDKVNPGNNMLTDPALLKITIRNPKTGKVTLKKVDQSGNVPVKGAKFIAYYRPFDSMTGETDLSGKQLTTRDELAAADFKLKAELAGTTDANGYLPTLTDKELDPGIYAFIEDAAPEGYDVRTTTAGKEIIYFAIVKGDMEVNVAGIPESVTAIDETARAETVTTKFEGEESVAFTVKNYQKVTLKAKKEVNSGNITLTDDDVWSITLNLYKDKNKQEKTGTVTIGNTTAQGEEGINFKDPSDPSKDALFSLGTTYYLEEVVSTPTSNFVLNEVLKDGEEVTDVEGGMYLFPIESLDGFTITAKNNWMFGRVSFGKVDKAQLSTFLSGAEFEVQYQNAEGNWVKVPGSTVTEGKGPDGEGNGVYTALIPLVSAELTEYHIVETKAPIDYLLPKGSVLSEELSLEDNVKEGGILITNDKGNHLTIYKNSNIHGADNNTAAGERTAEFAVYHDTGEGWELAAKDFITTDGMVTFLTVPGDNYAIAESYFDPAVFSGLESIYQGETELSPAKITTVEGQEIEAYKLISSEQDITVSAYNIPNIQPVIRKIDVGQYQGGAEYPKDNVKAEMNYAIYEVTAEDHLSAQPTRAEVEAFLSAEGRTAVHTGKTTTYDTEDPYYVKNGTTDLWTAEDMEGRWNPQKTYLLVETVVSAKDGGAYDTLRKDDPDVEWYKVIKPVENPDPKNPPVFELKNVYGDADVTLEKSVVESKAGDTDNDVKDGAVGSLLEGDRKAVFTLSPAVTSRNQMLESFILKDNGVKAFAGEDEVTDFNYTIDKIVVGGASHEVDPYYELPETAKISAVIIFKDGAGEEASTLGSVEIADVNDSQPVTEIPDGTKAFDVSYYCQDLIESTARRCDKMYVLGEQFTVQPTTMYMTAKRQADGTSEAPAKEITKFTNYAHADLGYWKWSADGIMPETPLQKQKDASATVNVGPVVLPKVAIEKSVPSPSVSLHQTVTYTVEVKNLTGSPAEFKNPIVLDILPTAVEFIPSSVPETVTASGGETLSIAASLYEGDATHTSAGGAVVSEFEKAILFRMSGTLGIGSTAKFTYQIRVSDTADLFTSVLQNDAYLSSAEHSYHTQKNPQGCPFVSDAEEYGKSLANAAAAPAIGGTALVREQGMEAALDREGGYATGDYRWLASSVHQNINELTTVTVRKAVWGDRDIQGFHDTGLGVASRTNGRFDRKGWVRWRLSVENGYTDREYIDHLQFGDVIARPSDGTQRNSKWFINMYDRSILTILNNEEEVAADKYTVYYYTGSTASAEEALSNALKTGDLSGWKSAEEIASSTQNWTEETAHEEVNDVTAFIVVFDADVKIQKNTNMILVYETKVVDVQDDSEFTPIAFTNDSNYYYFNYYDPTLDELLRSNTVNVTLMDTPVEIQGDVWIDEDQDGIQEETNRRDYNGYAIIQELKNSISFTITDMREAAHITTGNDTGEMSQWDGSESIRHFRFEDLGAATNIRSPYISDGQGSMILDPFALKGDDPYYYVLNSKITDNTEDGELLKIFKLTNPGAGHFMTDDPDAAGFKTSDNFRDNNFLEKGSGESADYETYPFYVMYSALVDQSKDIGFMMYRELELEKVALDDPDVKVEGAKFMVYGPYDDSALPNKEDHSPASGEALTFSGSDGEYTLDPEGRVTELETNEEGKIHITGLNWWKEYDVKETETAPGYKIGNAKASAADGSGTVITDRGDGVFTLRVPGKERTASTDQVRITNPRYAEVDLQAEKILESYSEDEYTFLYELRLDSVTPDGVAELNEELLGKDPIETIAIKVAGDFDSGTNSNTGKFSTIDVIGAGTYTFTIRELAPDPLPKGWTYDPQLEKTAVVKVVWNERKEQLEVESIEYSDPHTVSGETYLKFTNKYEIDGEWTPELTKKLTGRPLLDEEFTFTVTEDGEEVSTGKAYADGTIDFTPIRYESLKEAGLHTYKISEDRGDLPGVTYADPITATVMIENVNNELVATSVEYDPGSEFVNTFHAEGSWSPEIMKILEGRDMRVGEKFTVEVTDRNGEVVMSGTAVGGRDGKPVAFKLDPKAIEYTEADLIDHMPTTYRYTIKEVQGDVAGVVYDSRSYTVDVMIALHQNEDGSYSDRLDVTYVLPKDGLTFINKYSGEPPTGDRSGMVLWMAITSMSALLLGALLVFGLRNRRRKNR